MSGVLYDGPIIDAHHHVWEPGRNDYPWLSGDHLIPFRYGDYSAIKRDYLPPDYRRDVGDLPVVVTVYMEAEWNPADPIGETAYVHAIAARFGLPNAMIAQAWLDRADIADVLERQAAFPLVRSVRHKPEGPASPAAAAAGETGRMSAPDWRRGYALLARHGLHFDLQTPWWNLPEAARLAADFPETLMIVNHAGVPGDRVPATLAGWRRGMEALARLPNVAVKISGIGRPDHAWTVADNRVIVETIVDLFGGARAMFASNFPVDGLRAPLRTIFDGFRQIVADRDPAEQRALFFETAKRIYRPVLPKETP